MATTTTTSSAGRAPLGSVPDNANKRSAEEEEEDSKPAAASTLLSPFHQRIKMLTDVAATDDDKIIMFLGDDVLECIPGKLDELGVDEVEDLDDNAKDAAYKTLSQEQVDKHLHVMVVDRKLCEYKDECYNAIMFADPRNSEGDDMVCLNTYSSWCMYPVIQKLLTTATKELNKAKRAVLQSSSSAPTMELNNVAVEALNKTFGAILACDDMDHWKHDTESPEDCEKVAKKVSKLASDLLWFDNAELGFLEPHSRLAMLHQLETINKKWSDIGGVKYKTKTNGQGLGRSHAPPPPPAKKQKIAVVATTVAATAASTSSSGSANTAARLVSFLNAISDKKKLREKTCVQIKIASVQNPAKSALVVLSGATDMKKVNQLCAFITGHATGFECHSNRGTCIKGSRIELELDNDDGKLWLAAKSLSKQAASANAALIEDKTVKIIQVFQGLVTSSSSGIVYDSIDARNVKAYWVNAADGGERFEISVQAIIGNECLGTLYPMPRLVKHLNGYTPNIRTGFGKGVYVANHTLKGDRKGPDFKVWRGTSAAEIKKMYDVGAATPIANEDGSMPGDGRRFSAQNVAKAGLPI